MAKCPHCEKLVTMKNHDTDQVYCEVVGRIKKETMYYCTHCEKVLGFAYFMGGLLTGRP